MALSPKSDASADFGYFDPRVDEDCRSYVLAGCKTAATRTTAAPEVGADGLFAAELGVWCKHVQRLQTSQNSESTLQACQLAADTVTCLLSDFKANSATSARAPWPLPASCPAHRLLALQPAAAPGSTACSRNSLSSVRCHPRRGLPHAPGSACETGSIPLARSLPP